MNFRRAFLILGLLSFAAVYVLYRQNRDSARVRYEVRKLQNSRGLEQMGVVSNIIKQGPAGYSALAQALRAEDTLFDKQYDKWRLKLPGKLGDQLPLRPSKLELRRSIARIANSLGLVGARALVPAVEFAVEDSDSITSMELIRTLSWSIPESPRAVRILSNYVAKPSGDKLLLGTIRSSEVWRAVPQLAPLMRRWLKLSDQAGEAAEALGAMGTVSAPAVEDLVQVAEFGVAGDPPSFSPRMSYPEGDDPRVRNRCQALRALGLVGATNENVFRALEKGVGEEDQFLRCYASDGLGFLGAKALPVLPYLLDHLDRSNRLVLRYEIEAIGKMGPGAAAAVPILLSFCDKAAVDEVPEHPHPNRMIRWVSEPMHLPEGAAFALAEIDPERAREHLELLSHALFYRIPAADLATLRPLKDDLIQYCESNLKPAGSFDPFMGSCALNLVRVDPLFKTGLDVLETKLQLKTEPARSRAALDYFLASGDISKALTCLKESIESGDKLQMVFQNIGEFGSAAKPLAPLLLPYLESENFGLRMSSGRALRSISPESLPQVQETDK